MCKRTGTNYLPKSARQIVACKRTFTRNENERLTKIYYGSATASSLAGYTCPVKTTLPVLEGEVNSVSWNDLVRIYSRISNSAISKLSLSRTLLRSISLN